MKWNYVFRNNEYKKTKPRLTTSKTGFYNNVIENYFLAFSALIAACAAAKRAIGTRNGEQLT